MDGFHLRSEACGKQYRMKSKLNINEIIQVSIKQQQKLRRVQQTNQNKSQ